MATKRRSAGSTTTAFLKGKTVLVTGGTGTFGRACVARLLREPVGKIIVFSRDELKQSQLQHLYPREKRLRFLSATSATGSASTAHSMGSIS